MTFCKRLPRAMCCHWQLETEEGAFTFSSNPEQSGPVVRLVAWHHKLPVVLVCVSAFSRRTFLRLANFSPVPLQEQKIENCVLQDGIQKWSQMNDAWRAADVSFSCSGYDSTKAVGKFEMMNHSIYWCIHSIGWISVSVCVSAISPWPFDVR